MDFFLSSNHTSIKDYISLTTDAYPFTVQVDNSSSSWLIHLKKYMYYLHRIICLSAKSYQSSQFFFLSFPLCNLLLAVSVQSCMCQIQMRSLSLTSFHNELYTIITRPSPVSRSHDGATCDRDVQSRHLSPVWRHVGVQQGSGLHLFQPPGAEGRVHCPVEAAAAAGQR